MPAPLHPLKFAEAAKIDAIQMAGVTLESPACQACLEAFQNNAGMLIGMVSVPGLSAYITAQAIQAKATGKDLKAILDEQWPPGRHMEFHTNHLESLLMTASPLLHGMFHDQLKLLCVQAWTAFEVLIEDLHWQVIDENPSLFSMAVMERHQRGRQKIKGAKFTFRSRENFRDAYAFTFDNDAEISAAIGSNDLDAIVVVRNLLVHRNGVADLTFIRDDLADAPQLVKLFNPSLGAPLHFDGVVARTIIDAATAKVYELIQAVARWITTKRSLSE